MIVMLLFFILVIVAVHQSVVITAQAERLIIERLGRFHTILSPGIGFIFPFIDRVRERVNIKEQTIDCPTQEAITSDNVTVSCNGVAYYKVINPKDSVYGIDDVKAGIQTLAMTTLRSQIGSMSLDDALASRDQLNQNILQVVNTAAKGWGCQISRFELLELYAKSEEVRNSMEMIVKASRERKAEILLSEGYQIAAINRAKGDGDALKITTAAKAEALRAIGNILSEENGYKAAQLNLAERAIEAREALAKESTTLILPDGNTDVANVVSMAMKTADVLKQS